MRRSDVKPNASPPFTRTNWTRFCLAKLLKRHLESDSFIVRSVSRRACGMLLSRYLYGIIYFHLAVWSHSGRKSAKLMWRDVTCCYVSGLRRTQTDGWVDGRATEESLRFTSSIRICYALIFFLPWVMLGSDGIGLDNTSWWNKCIICLSLCCWIQYTALREFTRCAIPAFELSHRNELVDPVTAQENFFVAIDFFNSYLSSFFSFSLLFFFFPTA